MMGNEDWSKVMSSIVDRVLLYTEGRLLWIAQQEDDEFDDVFGFVIVDIPGLENGGFAYIRLVDARQADDAAIRVLAAKILGFAPDSPDDLSRRRLAAEYAISCIEERIAMEQRSIAYYQSKMAKVSELENG